MSGAGTNYLTNLVLQMIKFIISKVEITKDSMNLLNEFFYTQMFQQECQIDIRFAIERSRIGKLINHELEDDLIPGHDFSIRFKIRSFV